MLLFSTVFGHKLHLYLRSTIINGACHISSAKTGLDDTLNPVTKGEIHRLGLLIIVDQAARATA